MKIKFKAVTSRDTSRGYNGRILRNLKCAGLSRALEGNNTKIRTSIEEGRNVDLRDLSGYTPLFWAAVFDKADTVQLLHENGADIVATSRSGENAMHRALKFRGMNIYRYLLEKGLDPYAEDLAGVNGLYIACSLGPDDIVHSLCSADTLNESSLNAYSETYGTPLAAAAVAGRLNIVRVIVEAGAALEGRQIWYGTPLFAACAQGRQEVVEFLLSKGASTQSTGGRFSTAMEVAQKFQQVEIVQILERAQNVREEEHQPAESRVALDDHDGKSGTAAL